jgi:tRNA modification GTPase
MLHDEDTIVARATALGTAGVAIVRLSGPHAVTVAATFVHLAGGGELAALSPRYMASASLIDDSDVLDRGLVVRFAAPASFTGEDVVELHLHGNLLIAERAVDLAVANGARLATAGEFTRRAFLNGKLDLTQVEALGDLLATESERALRVAQRQFGGELRRRLLAFRERLLNLLALLELELDFVEEGYSFTGEETLRALIDDLSALVDALLAGYQIGNRLRRGPRVLLLGRPNAGKSSLFNALIGYSRSLVSPQAGTTRDYIEEVVTHNGVAFHVIDTAGLRVSDDIIEAGGVELAYQLIPLSDHVLYLIEPLSEDHVASEIAAMKALAAEHAEREFVPVITKSDLYAATGGGDAISVFDRGSLIALLDRLAASYDDALSGAIALVSQRQFHLLQEIAAVLDTIRSSAHIGTEFLSADLRSLLGPLSELSGSTTSEDVLNQLFGSFCIGK